MRSNARPLRLSARSAAVRALPHIADALLCLDTLWSEDFEDGRLYGRVRARDPFV
jgi:hypothetical protein